MLNGIVGAPNLSNRARRRLGPPIWVGRDAPAFRAVSGYIPMRALLAGAIAVVLMLGAARRVTRCPAAARPNPPLSTLRAALNKAMKQAGGTSGAYVVDLDNGQILFSAAANKPRLPASVEKLYTTSTALMRFGPNTNLDTTVYGVGSMSRADVGRHPLPSRRRGPHVRLAPALTATRTAAERRCSGS